MKKALSIALAVASFGAVASDRNIWDLQYLPNKGTVYGNSQLTMLSGKIDYKGTSANIEASGVNLAQSVGYSVTDSFLVTASLYYTDFQGKGKSGADSFNNTGWSDPTLDGRYRLLDDSFRLDVLAGGTVPMGDAYSSQNNHSNIKGNNDFWFQGGPRIFLGLEAGQKLDKMQYAVRLQADEILKSDGRQQGDGKFKDDSHLNWTLQGSLLNQFSDKLFLRSHASVHFIEGYNEKAGSDKTDIAPVTEYRLGTGLQYAVTTNVLGDIGVTYRQLNGSSGVIDDQHYWLWTVGARYQF